MTYKPPQLSLDFDLEFQLGASRNLSSRAGRIVSRSICCQWSKTSGSRRVIQQSPLNFDLRVWRGASRSLSLNARRQVSRAKCGRWSKVIGISKANRQSSSSRSRMLWLCPDLEFEVFSWASSCGQICHIITVARRIVMEITSHSLMLICIWLYRT